MRSTKLAISADGRPWKSWRASVSSSTRSSSIATRSACVAVAKNGSRPACSASSRSRRSQNSGGGVHAQLLVAAGERVLQPRAQRVGGPPHLHEHEHALGGDAARHEAGEAAHDRLRLAGARAAEQQHRPLGVVDDLALGRGQLGELEGHRS